MTVHIDQERCSKVFKQFAALEIVSLWHMLLRLCIIFESSYSQVRNFFFLGFSRNPGFKHISLFCQGLTAKCTFSLSTTKHMWCRNDVESSRSTFFIRIFKVGFMFSVLSVILLSSTFTEKNSPSARLTNKHFQLKTFPQSCSNKTFSNSLLHRSPAEDDRTNSAQEERLNLPYWTTFLVICALKDVPKYLDIMTSEFLNNVEASSILTCVLADTASAAWPEHPGSLDIMSLFLRLSFGMLVILVQWILRTHQDHLLQCHLGVRPCLYSMDTEVPTPNSLDDKY